MVDYPALAAEIALPKYAGMTDDQIAAALEAPETLPVDVPINQVVGYFLAHFLLGPIQRFAANPPEGTPQPLIDGLADFVAMLNSSHVTAVAMTDSNVASGVNQVLGAAVASNLIQQSDMDALLAMGQRTTTRAAELGIEGNHVTVNEMWAARLVAAELTGDPQAVTQVQARVAAWGLTQSASSPAAE